MSDGVVAGRLEIPVESDTTGFGQKLKRKIEEIARGIDAKVGVEFDEEGLKQKLEAAVKKAAEGVTAHIKVEVDTKGVQEQIKAAAKDATAKVKVDVEDAQPKVKTMREKAQAWLRAHALEVPAKTDDKKFLAKVESMLRQAKAKAGKSPVAVPMLFGDGKGGLSKFGKEAEEAAGGLQKFLLKLTLFQGIGSLIYPLIGAISGALGGLVPIILNASQSLGVLAGMGPALVSLGTTMAVVKLAFKGFGEYLKSGKGNLPDSMKEAAKGIKSFSGEWTKLRRNVQDRFWSQIADDIRPVGKVVLPLLSKSLSTLAGTVGTVAHNFLSWFKTPLFQGQFRSIMSQANTLTAAFGSALLGLVKGFANIAAASGPFTARLAKWVGYFTDWASSLASTGPKQDKFQKFLEYAGDKAEQLGRILKDTGTVLHSFFTGGKASGDRMLKTLEDSWHTFANWTKSAEGQNKIKAWFDGVEPIAREVGSLIKDLAKGFVDLGNNPATTALLKKIRTDLLPAVNDLLTKLSTNLAPKVVDFFVQLARAISSLGGQNSALSGFLDVLTPVVKAIADFAASSPGMSNTIGNLLLVLGGMRALSFLTGTSGIITGLAKSLGTLRGAGGIALGLLAMSGALGGMGSPAASAAAGLSTFLLLQPKIMGMVASMKGIGGVMDSVRLKAMYMGDGFTNAGGGVSGFISKIGTGAKMGLRGAMTGLMAAMGGPAGLGIAAVMTGVSVVLGKMAQAHQDAARRTAEHKQRVDELTGSLDAETGAITVNTRELAIKNLREKGALDQADKYGVSLAKVTDAALGNARAQGEISNQLTGSTLAAAQSLPRWADLQKSLGLAGVSTDAFGHALVNGGTELDNIKGKLTKATGNNNALLSSMLIGYNAAVKNTSGQRALAASLGLSASELAKAQRQHDQNNRAMGDAKVKSDAAAKATDAYKNALDRASTAALNNGKTVNKAKDALVTNTAAGRNNAATLKDLAAKAVTMAGKNLANGKSVGAVTKEMNASRSAFITQARNMGLSKTAAEKMANAAGLTKGKVDALTTSIKKQPTSHQTKITAPGATQADREVLAVTRQVQRVPRSKSVTVNSLTGAAMAKLRSMGLTVRRLPNGRISVSASTGAARAAINALTRTRHATVYVNAVRTGSTPYSSNKFLYRPSANGNIFKKFADGGIERALGAAKGAIASFANGTENHIAQIAKAGTWRVWAEDETGGEAYIPLAPSKRQRSMSILKEVADQFGVALMPKMQSFAQQAAPAPAPSMLTHAPHRSLPYMGGFPAAEPAPAAVSGGNRFEFAEGAIQVNNPTPEPASQSVPAAIRKVGAFGLFEQ